MEWYAKWIKPQTDTGDVCPLFQKYFFLEKPIKTARLFITALGTYEVVLNGSRVGEFVLALAGLLMKNVFSIRLMTLQICWEKIIIFP